MGAAVGRVRQQVSRKGKRGCAHPQASAWVSGMRVCMGALCGKCKCTRSPALARCAFPPITLLVQLSLSSLLYLLSFMVLSGRFLSMARCIALHPTCSWTMRFPFCSSRTNFDSSASRYGLMISLLQMPPGVSPLSPGTD
jgi:hypothetical protein